MYQTDLHKRFVKLSKPLNPIHTSAQPRLQRLKSIRVIAYDFYGTLFLSGVGDIGIDDGSLDAEVFLDVLQSSNIEIENDNKPAGAEGFRIYNLVVKHMLDLLKQDGIEYPEPDIRQVWKSVLVELQNKGFIQFTPSEALYSRVSVEFEARMNPVWPMPKAVEILTYFKEKEVTQGIISNSQFYTPIVLEALTEYSLTDLGFSDELLHWSFEEQMKKPGLTFYNNFIEKLNQYDSSISPEQLLYIGNDMLKDIYPAAKVGFKTALFAGDKRSLKWRKDDERCKNIEPDLILTDFSQLKECVV